MTRKKLHLTVCSGNNCVVTTGPESDCIFKFTGAAIRWFAKKGRRTSTFIKPFPGIASGGRLKAMITISQNGVRSNALMILHIPWGSRSGGNIPARFDTLCIHFYFCLITFKMFCFFSCIGNSKRGHFSFVRVERAAIIVLQASGSRCQPG